MNISQALKKSNEILKNAKIPINTISLDCQILLSRVLKKPKIFLFTHGEFILTKKQENYFFSLVKKRKTHKPISYLTGEKEFYGRKFFINKNVLIPRPETEFLVESVLKYIHSLKNQRIKLADIGTGSGCIAITLKKEMPKLEVWATDISKKTLKVAKKNCKYHKAKIFLRFGNFLSPFKKKAFDIVLANLPYLPTSLSHSQKKIFLRYEPKISLYGGKDGIGVYRQFFQQIQKMNNQPKMISCEIGKKQKKLFQKISLTLLPKYNLYWPKTESHISLFPILIK